MIAEQPAAKRDSHKLKLLHQLKSRLIANVPEAGVEKVILFGSWATGKARKDSDYDFLIVVRNAYDWQLRDKLAMQCYEFAFELDSVADVTVISQQELDTARGYQPFIRRAFRQGMVL